MQEAEEEEEERLAAAAPTKERPEGGGEGEKEEAQALDGPSVEAPEGEKAAPEPPQQAPGEQEGEEGVVRGGGGGEEEEVVVPGEEKPPQPPAPTPPPGEEPPASPPFSFSSSSSSSPSPPPPQEAPGPLAPEEPRPGPEEPPRLGLEEEEKWEEEEKEEKEEERVKEEGSREGPEEKPEGEREEEEEIPQVNQEKEEERLQVEQEKKEEIPQVEQEKKEERLQVEQEKKEERLQVEQEKDEESPQVEQKEEESLQLEQEKKEERLQEEQEKEERLQVEQRDTPPEDSRGEEEEEGEEGEEEEELSFSDPEDFVDDIEEEELLGDILQDCPQEADGIDSVIVVDNVPQVGPDRLDKLKNVIHKIFSKFGKITNDFYPEADGQTKGYIFLEYASPTDALDAVKNADGYKLDKQHTFRVNLFTDFDKYMTISDEWEIPEKQPFKDLGNLRYWLEDPDCRDQYSVIFESGEMTSIYWNDVKDPVVIEERARWTETYVRWSPRGTYLATFHQQGIALWGGENFKKLQRFSHQGVQLIDFSPCERYMVSFSSLMDTQEDPQAIIIWDILTGQKKRGFHCESSTHWPIFKWSHDGKFFARMTSDTLSIYETPSMGLLDKKSLKIGGISDFSWSPGGNIIAFWVPEDKDIPARVTLMQLPSRQEIRVRNLFNVVDCKLHWQKNGDYLCVKVDRTPKGTQGVVTNFEIFRMREKQVPVDVVEMKESIIAFAWEPNGSKFAVLHGESPRISCSFYHVKNNGKIELIKMFDKQQANTIFWSPQGQFLVLAGLRSMNGALAFVDTSDCTMMNIAEHYTASDVEWDPTGRFLVTSVSWWSHKMDNAYWLWTFQGRLLQKNNKERFCQLLWRPRPPTLLTQDQIKQIKKDLKKYSKIFEQKDRLSQSKASKELVDRRRTMMEDFKKYRKMAQELYMEQRKERLDLRGGVDTDELDSNVDDWEEETVEFFINEEIITVVEPE